MDNFEERIKALPPNNCRVCDHYKRVNFTGYKNVMNRTGFCILGQLDGDYGLYLSTSASRDCMGFIPSELNLRIREAEHKLSMDEDDYLSTLHDKRTSNYKEIEPILKATQNFIESSEKKPKGIAWMIADQKIRKIGCEHFMELNRERFKEVHDMVTLQKADYSKFLAMISVEIHNRFCKCDKLEFKSGEEIVCNSSIDSKNA